MNILNINKSNVNVFAETLTTNILSIAARNIDHKNLPEFLVPYINQKKENKNRQLKNPIPWWTEECTKKRKERKKALQRYRRQRTTENYEEFRIIRKEAKKVFRKAKETDLKLYYQTLDPSKHSIKEIWRKLKSIKGNVSTSIMPAIKIPERAESDLQKAELLAKCFFTVSSNENLGANEINRRHKTLKILESESSINNMDDRSINADITINEVTNAIKSKTNSAAGPDILNYEILKNIPISTIIIVTELFNMIWRSGDIPLAWKVATVIPILKDGKEPHDSNSYRPIALTSHIGKILETIVKDRLQFMLEKNKLISNTQSGFRKSHCTMDQIMKLENDVKQGFKKKEKTVAVFLDVSKAYDECWRDGALYKIKEIGIKGRALSY
jgi:hypothetical protein